MVKREFTKRDTTGLGNLSRRLNTFKYYLKHEDFDEPLEICKKMFLNTLDINEWMLHNWIKQSTHGLAGKRKNNQDAVDDEEDEIIPPKRVALTKRINHLQE